mmetsp:Transcript_23657/g.93372  ORF Transcript_23657/g.93372 Transcript_23657/m.93372 type:complete len:99 (+) Transcript_23657:1310-1606(+)
MREATCLTWASPSLVVRWRRSQRVLSMYSKTMKTLRFSQTKSSMESTFGCGSSFLKSFRGKKLRSYRLQPIVNVNNREERLERFFDRKRHKQPAVEVP